MNILAIETSTNICSVALFINSKLIDIISSEESRSHNKNLGVFIKNILINNNIDISDLNALAVSSGPGSFTGLRIGFSLLKGISLATGLPIIPTPTLYSIEHSIQNNDKHIIGIHSHSKNIYIQEFNNNKPINNIVCESYDKVNYNEIYGYGLNSNLISSKYIQKKPSAKYIGELALLNYKDWLIHDLDKISPNYINNLRVG